MGGSHRISRAGQLFRERAVPAFRGAESAGLTSDEEERWATELRHSRETYAKFLLQLPREWREHVLEDDPDGPELGGSWPLSRLDASFDRLLTYTDEPDGRRIEEIGRQARRIKRRIDRAREKLILANLAIVHFLARKVWGRGISFRDLVQEGTIGLIEAVERFDPGRQVRLSSYAHWWIRKSLVEAFSNSLRIIRLPQAVQDEARTVKLAAEELANSLGREPDHEEVAKRMRLPEATIRRLSSIGRDPQSFDDVEKGIDHLGFMGCPCVSDPLESAIQNQFRKLVIRSLDVLRPRERRIVRIRFGIDGERWQTLEQIAKMYGVSRERVRQIQSEALAKLRRHWRLRRP